MHEFTPAVEELAAEILKYSLERLKDDPPLDGPRSAEDLFQEVEVDMKLWQFLQMF
jgi:hypothetical protein